MIVSAPLPAARSVTHMVQLGSSGAFFRVLLSSFNLLSLVGSVSMFVWMLFPPLITNDFAVNACYLLKIQRIFGSHIHKFICIHNLYPKHSMSAKEFNNNYEV